ncbi:MAG: hypothetical protein ACR2KZ_16825 [Segetibacter sp.]
MLKKYIILLALFFSSNVLSAQSKAIVIQNLWNNDLNGYNPKEYYAKLFAVLKAKLAIKDFVANPTAFSINKKDETWEKDVKDQLTAISKTGENAYFIAIASELRLPALNLGKLLFKNPPRSSKLTFTIHVYDPAGVEVIGDTIINRGCVVKTVDEEKGSRYFYSDYNNFMSDVFCHIQYIEKILQEKPLLKKQRLFIDTK